MRAVRFRRRAALTLTLSMCISMIGVGAAHASTPPSPAPYPHVELQGSGPPIMQCLDSTAVQVYNDSAWTLEPLLRGPLFAPTVLFLSGIGAENRPVVPLRFTSRAFPVVWSTVDGGTLLSGTIESISGRPVGYGPVASTHAPMVTCSYSLVGHEDFGAFRITKPLQQMLGLPKATIGRTVAFDGEGDVTFETRQDAFPQILENYDPAVQPWLVADDPPYQWVNMPTITCRNGTTVVYKGPARTLAPAVRGLDWSPIAFWLNGDRIVTPHWSRLQLDLSWATVDAVPARSGTTVKDYSFAPAGVGKNPYPAANLIDCTWKVQHDDIVEVTPYLLVQLDLPTRTVSHQIHVTGSAVVHAYVPVWLFPPK